MTLGSLIDATDEKPSRQTKAPDHLNPAQLKRLAIWAEETIPWVRRGALGSLLPLEAHVAEVLEYWASTGKRRANWVATIQVRLRDVEIGRVSQLARAGSDDAKLALRSPKEWVAQFERRARLKPEPSEAAEIIRPEGGRVLNLRRV